MMALQNQMTRAMFTVQQYKVPEHQVEGQCHVCPWVPPPLGHILNGSIDLKKSGTVPLERICSFAPEFDMVAQIWTWLPR